MKTHWKKKFNYDYLGSYSIAEGTEPIWTILKTEKQMVKNNKGQEEECFVCYFKEKPKPMILNRTNSKAIEHALQTPYIEDWVGQQVQVYVQKGVRAFGETVDALRIKPTKPNVSKPVLEFGSDKFEKAVEFYKDKGSLDQIKNKYSVSEEVEKAIIEHSKLPA